MTDPPYIPEVEAVLEDLGVYEDWKQFYRDFLQPALPALHAAWLEEAKERLGQLLRNAECSSAAMPPGSVGRSQYAYKIGGLREALTALGPKEEGERVVDLEGNDVAGCEWCEALQARDWQTVERLSDDGTPCTCTEPPDLDTAEGQGRR